MIKNKGKALVVNDDGINSAGIKVLVEIVKKLGYEVLVVAPHEEQSAKSQALNFHGPFVLEQNARFGDDVTAYSLTGTPADCVKFAYYHIKYDFEIVFSGVNNGLNLGFDMLYSGTVGAAKEAALLGAKGIAISTKRKEEAAVTKNFLPFWEEFSQTDLFKKGQVFNINVPLNTKGYCITHQGVNNYIPKFVKQSNGTYISVISEQRRNVTNDSRTDIATYFADYISVTPITTDKTDYTLFIK